MLDNSRESTGSVGWPGGQRAAALRQHETCCQTLLDELGVEPSEETKALYQKIKTETQQARKWNGLEGHTTFGAWLKRRRYQLDLTQQALANRVSCSVGTIRKMEADERRPSRQLAGLLAHQLEIPNEQYEAFINFARSEPYLTDVSIPVLPPGDDQIPVIPQEPQENPIQHNLPAQSTPFVGRERELVELESLIADPQTRLVTIVGPGGMGKTRLALAAAEGQLGSEQFRDGIYFIDLAPTNGSGRVVSATTDSLGLQLKGVNDATAREQLLEYLDRKKMLLLFDNCEHVLAGMDLAADILRSVPGVQILATSRERLHLRMEQVYPIEGLPSPEWETPEDAEEYTSVRLFLQSAHRNRPDFSLEGDGDLINLTRICRLVAGMPLALELAAAWVDVLPLSEIATGLQEGLDLLETKMRDIPERHHSVRAAIDHSWELLGEKECGVFSRLSIFRGGFTREAAQAVADASLWQLELLVNKSFLKYDLGADRYQVHELMRQYGAEHLPNAGSVRTRHLDFFVTFAEQAEYGSIGTGAKNWVNRRNREIDNFRAAFDWATESGQAQAGLQLGGLLHGYWISNGDYREGRQRLERLLALPEAARRTPARAYSLHVAGNLACHMGDIESGFQLIKESIAIGRELGEAGKVNLGWALIALGEHYWVRDMAAAQSTVEEGIAILRQAGEPWQLWLGYTVRGWLAYRQGDNMLAQESFGVSLAFSQEKKYLHCVALSMVNLGHLYYLQSELSAARAYLEKSLAIMRSIGSLRFRPLTHLGDIALLQGDHQHAKQYYEEALTTYRKVGIKRLVARAINNLGVADYHSGEYSRAAKRIHESLLMIQDMPHLHDKTICLLAAAGVQKSPRRGALLLGVSWSNLKAVGRRMYPIYQVEKKRIEKAARAALGEPDFEAAYAEGKNMPVDQAIAMALAESDVWVDVGITSFDWDSTARFDVQLTSTGEKANV